MFCTDPAKELLCFSEDEIGELKKTVIPTVRPWPGGQLLQPHTSSGEVNEENGRTRSTGLTVPSEQL